MLARQPAELEEDEEPATADLEGPRAFIEDEVLPSLETRRQQVANRPVICDKAYGESLDSRQAGAAQSTRPTCTPRWPASALAR